MGTTLFKKVVILSIRLYQIFLAPYYCPCCRFIPTCSAYAQEAIAKHGVIKGLHLTGKRLLRCHPFGKDGYDPIP